MSFSIAAVCCWQDRQLHFIYDYVLVTDTTTALLTAGKAATRVISPSVNHWVSTRDTRRSRFFMPCHQELQISPVNK